MQRIIILFRSEFKRIFIFGIIGAMSLVLNLGLYSLLTRVLLPQLNQTISYTIVNVFVTWVNYMLNKKLTFKSDKYQPGAVGRFAGVAITATGLNAVLFWLGHDVLQLYDLLVIIANAFIVAAFTFTSHRQFTFHPDPWRHFKREKRSV